MEFYDEKIKALAIEIYELDAEVYKKLGSSLGRVFVPKLSSTTTVSVCVSVLAEV